MYWPRVWECCRLKLPSSSVWCVHNFVWCVYRRMGNRVSLHDAFMCVRMFLFAIFSVLRSNGCKIGNSKSQSALCGCPTHSICVSAVSRPCLFVLLVVHCCYCCCCTAISREQFTLWIYCVVSLTCTSVYTDGTESSLCVCVCVYTTIASNSYSFVVWWCRVADSALSRMNIQNEKYWAKLLSLLCCVCISNDNAATMFSTMSAALVLSVGLLCRCENC